MSCRSCGLFWRVFEDDAFELETHYEVASYTNLVQEENWKRAREPFFLQLVGLIDKFHQARGNSLLDFGCSYGHFMDIATGRGYSCTGVELVDHLRARLRSRYPVYKNLQELSEQRFDAITCIDSLYCSPNPVQDTIRLASLLKEDGVMLVRIANRAPLLKLMLLLRGGFSNHHMGDQLFVLNDKTMRLLAKKANLVVRKVILREHKRKVILNGCKNGDSWLHPLVYGLLPFVCTATSLKWTPGLIYILQKDLNSRGSAARESARPRLEKA